MKTKITWIVVALFVIGIVWVIAANRNSSPTPSMGGTTSAPHETINPNAGATAGQTASSTSAKTYTLADVAKHTDSKSCWTAINGKVYDVTSWISQHPGGPEAILSTCGKDASAAFNGQHGGERRPAQELATFYIGDLAQ
jgi:cytochrome b involved in lipid metabolism